MTADSPEQSDEGLEDDGLEFVRSHCEGFYREPSIGAYFNTRLAVLAAVNEHREQFVAWANEGVRFHELHITIPSVESDDDTSDPPSANSDPLQWYIQTETISLQHHALETLLRLYTGLLEASNWLDPLMALTDRDRNLPRLVEQHLTSNSKSRRDMRSDVSYLLLGRSEVPEDDADQVAAIDNLSGILQDLRGHGHRRRRTEHRVLEPHQLGASAYLRGHQWQDASLGSRDAVDQIRTSKQGHRRGLRADRLHVVAGGRSLVPSRHRRSPGRDSRPRQDQPEHAHERQRFTCALHDLAPVHPDQTSVSEHPRPD